MNFAVQADHKEKIKENEKIDKYLALTRELEKLINVKVTVIPIVVGALGTVPKSLKMKLRELEIRGRIDTIQTTEYKDQFRHSAES